MVKWWVWRETKSWIHLSRCQSRFQAGKLLPEYDLWALDQKFWRSYQRRIRLGLVCILYFSHGLLFDHAFFGHYTALVLDASTWQESKLLQEDKNNRCLPDACIQHLLDYRSCRLPGLQLLLGYKYRFTRVYLQVLGHNCPFSLLYKQISGLHQERGESCSETLV